MPAECVHSFTDIDQWSLGEITFRQNTAPAFIYFPVSLVKTVRLKTFENDIYFVCVHVYHRMCVEVRGQCSGAGSPLPA